MSRTTVAELIAAVIGITLGCTQCRQRDGVRETDARPTGAQLFWLRNVDLLDGREGRTVRRVVSPTLVELETDGRVHTPSGSAEAFDGYVRASVLKAATDGEGLSLYAQQLADLHLDSITGPVVGRIHPGALVSVAAVDEHTFAVAMPGFRKATANGPATVVAYVEKGSLRHEPVNKAPSRVEGRLLRDVPPGLDLYPTPDSTGSAFANPLCGDARVVVQGDVMSRISQSFAGVELLGWSAGRLDFKRGPIRCSVRIVSREDGRLVLHPGPTAADRVDTPSVPQGFVGADPNTHDELPTRMKTGGHVHWLTPTAVGVRCREWKFERTRPAAKNANGVALEGQLSRVEPVVIDGDRLRASFSVGYRPLEGGKGEISLGGPHWHSRDSKEARGGYSCMIRYAFVGTMPNALRMLPGEAPDARIVAWHADDEERWFDTKEACLEAAERATDVLRRDPEAHPPGGVHVDCFDELGELE